MLTCFSCLNTKEAIKDINNNIKKISIKASRGHKHPKSSTSSAKNDTETARAAAAAITEETTKKWVAEVEPGVLITFVSLSNGGNHLKRIRFSEDVFDAWKAQKWWLKNSEQIYALYDIRRAHPFQTPPPSEVDGLVISPNDSPIGSCGTQSQESIEAQRSNGSLHTLMPGVLTGESSADGSTTVSNGDSQGDAIEWVQEYESGVFVTVRSYPDGTRELRRVELSRDRFGEVRARVWWEENKERLHKEYS